MVGMTGFEPVLPCSQNKCFAKLSYIPKYWLGHLDSNQGNARFRVWCLTTWLHPNNGGLRRARTFDKTVNSRLLYPLSYKSVKAKPTLWRTASSYVCYRFLGFPSSLFAFLLVIRQNNGDLSRWSTLRLFYSEHTLSVFGKSIKRTGRTAKESNLFLDNRTTVHKRSHNTC